MNRGGGAASAQVGTHAGGPARTLDDHARAERQGEGGVAVAGAVELGPVLVERTRVLQQRT